MINKINDFLIAWQKDGNNIKPAFKDYFDQLSKMPDNTLDFIARPGISYSLRAKNNAQKKRDLYVLVDVIDDDVHNRWLSVCFYADMITDPEAKGDFVPDGLLGEDAMCFNLEEADPQMKQYIADRINEAAIKAAE